MTKRIQAKYKISRSLGANLWGRPKDPFEFKNYGPGQHGPLRRRVQSDYAKQLRAKQALRRYYNITEKQFFNTYKKSAQNKGDTGANFVGMLERRLDMIVFRANFVPSIFAARQFVTHRHVLVNGKTVNIPGYMLKEGDVVTIREKSRALPMVLQAMQAMERELPGYIEVDFNAFSAAFKKVPSLDEVPYPVKMEINLIIEFYSR
ncbi:MAG: 30S ribosomal protein S4 [Rickettsiales bacterium]